MDCGFCGEKMVWQNDFDACNLGYDEDGIVTYYSCPCCGAEWEGYQRYSEVEE